jgi:glycosyltransferase involved in cell wall biosynthesis
VVQKLSAMREMFVNHLSTYLTGGATIAARRLHHALLDAGHESRFLYGRESKTLEVDDSYDQVSWAKPPGIDIRRRLTKSMHWPRRLLLKIKQRRALPARDKRVDFFSFCQRIPTTPFPLEIDHDQILHLHWVANLFDYATFFQSIPVEFPIVWTMHDMNVFTGGCHYSGDCQKYVAGCNHCPQLARPGMSDLAQQTYQTKLQAYVGKNLHIIAPSRWIEREASRSELLKDCRSIQTIHYGLDTTQFVPKNKLESKRQLGLPADALVIAFGADVVNNPRKGVKYLLDALSQIKHDNVLGIYFGSGALPVVDRNLPSMRALGFVKDPAQLAAAYSAADLFVIPSLEDNLPLTGLEAMACGTPVVGFAAGGITDYVRPGETGLLAQVRDAADLAGQIQWMLDHPQDRQRMGTQARKMVEREFNRVTQTQRHVELYQSLLAHSKQGTFPNRAA